MQKKYILIVLVIITFLGTAIIVVSTKKKISTNDKLNAVLKLPELNYKILQKGKNKGTKNPYVINFFEPSCEACKNMAKKLKSEPSKHESFNIIMLSLGNLPQTTQFIKDFGLSGLSNLTVGCDTAQLSVNVFRIRSVPSYFIYNVKKELVEQINGETSLENLFLNN